MQNVHEIGVPDRSPERLAFEIAVGDLDLDSLDATITNPGLRFLDESTRNALTTQFGSNTEVGDLCTLGLLENWRSAIDAHDTESLGRPVSVVDENFCVGIALQRTQEFAEFTLGDRTAAHSEERIERGVMLGDQGPQRGNSIDLAYPRDPHSATQRAIEASRLLSHFAPGTPSRRKEFSHPLVIWIRSPGRFAL